MHQGGFAAAVAAQESQSAPRREGDVEIGKERDAVKPFAQPLGGQQFFGFPLGPFKGDAHLADTAVSGADLSQFVLKSPGLFDAVTGLGRSRLGATPQPFGLTADLVGQPLLQGLPLKEVFGFFLEKITVGAAYLKRALRIDRRQFNHPVDRVFEKSAVVADQEKGAWTFRKIGCQEFFQPENALDVQMVGRLVHDQDLGPGDQGSAEGEPFAPAAGEQADLLLRILEAAPAQQGMHPVVLLGRVDLQVLHRLVKVVHAAGFLVKTVLLGHITDPHQFLEEHRAAVRVFHAAKDFEQGGFSGAVGANQANTVTGVDHEGDAGKKILGAKGLGKPLAAEQGTHRIRLRLKNSQEADPFRSTSSARG